MRDSLRDRIAAVLKDEIDARAGTVDLLEVADAVIAELGDLIAPQYHCVMPGDPDFVSPWRDGNEQ